MEDLLLHVAIGLVLCFAYVNGFHDGGNVIATAVCSRSMNPRRALIMGGLAEFAGAIVLGTAVATTMAEGIFDLDLLEKLPAQMLCKMIIAAVCGGMAWNLATWALGLPSSSSHALIGGLVGAGLVTMGRPGVELESLVRGVALPMLISPIIGILVGYFLFGIIKILFGRAHRGVRHLFEVLQRPCLIFLAGSHGSNDAQKSMGVIALLLASGRGELHGQLHLPDWVILSCAGALALGLVTGGWRMVKSVGYGICRLEPVHSFASQVTAASVIVTASLMGGPVSTTQVVASSVMGVGAQRRLGTVRWTAAKNIAYAWFLTVPASGAVAAAAFWAMERLVD